MKDALKVSVLSLSSHFLMSRECVVNCIFKKYCTDNSTIKQIILQLGDLSLECT